jgi:endonuclease III-like uncharacterized protein
VPQAGRGDRSRLEPPPGSPLRRRLLRLYAALLDRYGARAWWPGPAALHALPRRQRAVLVRLARRHGGSLRRALRQPLPALRAELLAVPGIGSATVDAILLVAAGRPVFAVDASTRRILSRHRLVPPGVGDDALQSVLMDYLPRDPALFNEYHARLLRVAKEYCRPSIARCAECPLRFDLGGRPPRLPR